MSVSDLGIFKLMARKMEYLTDRQSVIAQNVANADTPDYKPRDMTAFNFRSVFDEERRLRPTVTSPTHLIGSPLSNGLAVAAQEDRGAQETKLDGNAVDIEREMMKMAETSADYGTTLNLYRKNVRMIQSVLRGR